MDNPKLPFDSSLDPLSPAELYPLAGCERFKLRHFTFMTKHDLVVRVSNKTGLAHAQAVEAVETVFEAIIESLGREERIELRNFGVFEVRRRKPRIGRNPAKPDKEYPVPARAVAKFKPGKEMKEIVGKLASAGEENSKSQNPNPN